MRRVFVGHRGVGKTSLLQRHQTYFPQIPHFDLDQQIENKTQVSISDYFNQHSEIRFRQIENEVYQDLVLKHKEFTIAVGAGFDPKNINQETEEIIFVSRATDYAGRLFLNRPRLNPEISPLDESKKRYLERNIHFVQRATRIYHMPEGIESANELEASILFEDYHIQKAYYTLSVPEIIKLKTILKNHSGVELRTDLIDSKTIQQIIDKNANFNWLVSYRTVENLDLPANCQVDWDIQLGTVPSVLSSQITIYSSHDENIDVGIVKLRSYPNSHLKLCPIIESFDDLKKGLDWQQADPDKRSFLPSSADGRWVWFRQLAKYFQKINFIRNFINLPDQPSVYEWLILPDSKPKAWAAVLGQPVYFSRTPLIHQSYFAEKESFVTRISLSAEDLKTNLTWLNELGLTYAAVTSPLKETAFDLSTSLSTEAKNLKSVNTLLIQTNSISGHNTDLSGFEKLVEDIKFHSQDTIAVWGGGGTLEMIKSVFPKAHYYSSQTGSPRNEKISHPADIKTLIWAAPRLSNTVFPGPEFDLIQVIDLNYIENSMGLEYVIEKNINYISGLKMFKQQAAKQQEYWSSK